MYSKLFASILDSSVWLHPHPTRIVWLTLLAAKDADGFARFATIENLATRARVSQEEAEAAVATLESPDAMSSNPDHEGRRIERVPGGWVVLNATLYDAIIRREQEREANRDRVRRHREKSGVVSSGVAAIAASPTWLTPICDVWERHLGAGSFTHKKAAGLLGRLTKAGHQPEAIAAALDNYLAATDLQYVSLARFAETFAGHTKRRSKTNGVGRRTFQAGMDALRDIPE